MRHLLAIAALAAGVPTDAADIVQIDPESLTTTDLDDLNDLDGGPANFDDVLSRDGLSLAERFAGQTLHADGDFDVIGGTPADPLALQPGAPSENVSIFHKDDPWLKTVVAGNGPVGYPDFDAIGEGALAILFEADQHELGIELEGADNGCLTLEFYRRDGSLIDSVLVCNATSRPYAFRQEGGVTDIAGVLITNADPWGLGYDNIRYSAGPDCGADFNGDGSLDVLDFVAFQNAFAAADPAADCNADGQLNVLDFACFQSAFTAGCA